MPVRLHAVDLGVVGLYLVAITLFGLRFAKKGIAKDRSLRGYFLADKTVPWWAIALSIVSAETSTLTIIGTPGLAFAGDFGFLQIVMGYMLGRVVVATIFLPKYFHGEMLTAYQLIERRFGKTLYKVTAGLFLLTRAAAEGVRVFAVSIVVGIAIGTGDVLSIAIISALTLLYTFEGGMAAVIWTDVVQMAIYLGGTAVAMWSLGQHVPGGWAHIFSAAGAAHKLHLFDFALNLTTTYTFWAGLLGGAFLTTATHGTDQLFVQRLLAGRNLKEARAALLSSGVVIFVQFTMFLLIGAGLWVFYGAHPGALAVIGGGNGNRIFPGFIVQEMPIGIAGLLVAAILAAAMSNLSAALNSLSSTSVVDFYMGWRPEATDRERIVISRASTVMWALVLFAVAVYSVHAGGKGNVVEIGLSIASVAYGCLLGVFLLGTLTKYATQSGAIAGMVTGFAVNLTLWKWPAAHVAGVTIPTVAWTWYVLIGALVTFAVGLGASMVSRKRGVKVAVAAVVFLSVALSSTQLSAQTQDAPSSSYDFTKVSADINTAIAAKKLPGAVLIVGHDGKVVFEHAYGLRKYAGEPGLDGKPSPAEAMTVETVFDMASLSKCLVTATAVMQLVEAGKVDVDAPVATYLPDFGVNGKEKITVRELLTHYSGLAPDVDLKDPWGLAAPNKAEGIRRAIQSTPTTAPGTHFEYSDINYITLGALVEKVSGEPLDAYANAHIFRPMGLKAMWYLQLYDCKGQDALDISQRNRLCDQGFTNWNNWIDEIAPTAHDDQGTAETNPNFDRLLRGMVHDPTTRRMGGIAGHAGVFATATDVATYAQDLLDKLLYNKGPFPLKQETLKLMTQPEQPNTALAGATIFTPDGKPTTGIAARAFGWDINSAFSRPRGEVFPIGSFGHTGFTGTSLWMDPTSDTYVVLLANAVHPRGAPPISPLRSEVATDVAKALNLGGTAVSTGIDVLEQTNFAALKEAAARHNGKLRIGLLTNQTGLDAQGKRTIDVLISADPQIQLTKLFSPEHGIFGVKDSANVGPEADPATGLKVTSLYGPKDSDKRPKPEDLKDLDAIVIDLQDAGVRFYTYETIVGYFLEAAARELHNLHPLEVILLDRPNPIGGIAVQGAISDQEKNSYVNYTRLPLRHGMTLGELARFLSEGPAAYMAPGSDNAVVAKLTVVPMKNWRRDEFFDQTGIKWMNPSPNLHNAGEEILYPGLGMMDGANVSVGRGSSTPFEVFGAGIAPGAKDPWFNAKAVADYLTARNIPGVTFATTKFEVAEDANKYPYHGQTIEGVRMTVTDRVALDSPEMGIEILAALHHLYPTQFKLEKAGPFVANTNVIAEIGMGEDPRTIARSWTAGLEQFKQQRAKYILYQ